jgi:hypothetical protein
MPTRDKEVKRLVSNLRKGSELEELLALQLTAAKIPFEREVSPFAPERKFRFDFGIDGRLLVECEGQIWHKGGHSSGTGITRDIEKANLCTLRRVPLLRFTREMIESGEALEMIERALGNSDSGRASAPRRL